MDNLNIFLNNLNQLEQNIKPLWGKMTPQHMIEHLIMAVKMGNGKLSVNCFSPEDRLPILKKILLSERPLPHNFINPIIGEDLLPLEFDSIDTAKQKLADEIKDYYKYFEENPKAILTNATFGNLNKHEWDVFHRKHFTHHLAQFGL